MANNSHRKRGGAFHLDADTNEESDHDVQFVTPYYDESTMPEPLDLSKLCLDDDLFEDDADGEKESQQEKAVETRGRSRSRSVHENDLGGVGYLPTTDSLGTSVDGQNGTSNQNKKSSANGQNNTNTANSNGGDDKAGRKGGPLQHREVQALKKGLEEANQSINRNQNREDEEERMAADAEKRKRLLASNSSAANTTGEATRRVKLLMLGDSGVGKSSLIMRWTLDTFSTSLQSTVGVNFKSRKVNVSNELIQVQVWDTAGQEQFHKITTSYYKGAQGIMLVYDVTDTASLANIDYWLKNIKSHASDLVQVALIGNKTDLRTSNADPSKKCCETLHGQEIANKYGIPFFETSAKDAFNVEIAFLTLVEHIADGNTGAGSGGVGAHNSPNNIAGAAGPGAGLNHSSSSSVSSSGSSQKSIVEKAEKSRFLGAFKGKSSSSKGVPPIPPVGSVNGDGTTNNNNGGDGSGGGGAGEGDKEKCIIS